MAIFFLIAIFFVAVDSGRPTTRVRTAAVELHVAKRARGDTQSHSQRPERPFPLSCPATRHSSHIHHSDLALASRTGPAATEDLVDEACEAIAAGVGARFDPVLVVIAPLLGARAWRALAMVLMQGTEAVVVGSVNGTIGSPIFPRGAIGWGLWARWVRWCSAQARGRCSSGGCGGGGAARRRVVGVGGCSRARCACAVVWVMS